MVQQAVYHSLNETSRQLKRPVVTIGNFDGVHLGHQAIFEQVHRRAREHDSTSVALTFRPHPVRFFRPDTPPFRLTTERQKLDLLDEYGLDATVVVDFDEALAGLSPAEFVDEVLCDGLDARSVVVGQEFAFGKGRAGTTDDLERLCAERDIDAHIVPHVEFDGEPVSSTRVRKALAGADMQLAMRLLGRPYRIYGRVVRGDQRGRQLGFPTANIATDNPLLPPHGVYATTLHVDELPALHSITNVGTRPTFDGDAVTVETFILERDPDDDRLDLYGEDVQLDFWRHIRPEKEFDSADDLIAQIERDVELVRSFFML